MEDPTCIVCLGELATAPSDSPAANAAASPQDATLDDALPQPPKPVTSPENIPGVIAHLLPCGHNLHNDCLQPWVERANSCPICRTSFNMVELCTFLSGPAISSYGVQDKQQTADVDPSMIVDDELFEEGPAHPCIFCDEYGDDENLLLCDGCSNSCHTYCTGLSRVPRGTWFCQFCQQEGLAPSRDPSSTRRRRAPRGRRGPARATHTTSTWNEIWRHILTRTQIDLDFPFEEDPEEVARTRARQQEFADWQRRFSHAEQQGGAARFRDTASAVLSARRNRRTPTPIPESQEEIRAWNAFDKANQLQMDARPGSANSRKRNRPADEPVAESQHAQPERQLKRPRQRRALEQGEQAAEPVSDAAPGPSRPIAPIPARPAGRPGEGPTFLQSLLEEVQTAPLAGNQAQSPENANMTTTNTSNPASPAASPASSTPSSPRGRSISPTGPRSRPASPPPLTSRVEPAWYLQSTFSPVSPVSPTTKAPAPKPAEDGANSAHSTDTEDDNAAPACLRRRRDRHSQGRTLRLRPESPTRRSSQPTAAEAGDAPSPRNMTFSEKEEIQTLVKDYLKPRYRKQEINSGQYTEINREVSRHLYELIAEGGGLNGKLDKWRLIAASEVENAVKALRPAPQVIPQAAA